MTDLDEMRRVAARDLAAAKARLELIGDMALLITTMRSRGFNPQLTQRHDAEDLMLSISVDLNDLRVPGLRLPDPPSPYPPRPDVELVVDAFLSSPAVVVQTMPAEVADSDVSVAPDAPQSEIASEGGEEPAPEQQTAPEAETPDPRRPWTEADDKSALFLDRAGKNVREIADATHRSWQAVAKRLKALKTEAAAQPEPAPEETAPEDGAEDPAPAEAPEPITASPSGPMLNLDALSVRERAIERRLQAAGYPEPFTPNIDLCLVIALLRGDGIAIAAEKVRELGADIPRETLLARYRALMPEPSVDDQPALLSVLRQRVAKAG